MGAIKTFFGSILGKCITVAAVLAVAFVIHNILEDKQDRNQITKGEAQKSQREMDYAESVGKDNQILKAFEKHFPDASVLLASEEDVTDDGLKDLVVICKMEDLTRTVIAIDSGDGKNYNFSSPIPAPVENQRIQFKNIDKEAEIEIIITGEKKGAVGYAIYRMIDGEPADLFGEGMEDCC